MSTTGLVFLFHIASGNGKENIQHAYVISKDSAVSGEGRGDVSWVN